MEENDVSVTTGSMYTTLVNYKQYMNSSDSCSDPYHLTLKEAKTYGYSKIQTYVASIILPGILVFGVFGNALFVYVAVRIPHMRTITNRYLVNLAIADIVFLMSAVGKQIWKYALSPIKDDETALGRFGCLWTYFLSDVAYFASLIFVTLVSADRFVAVCRPQDRHSFIKGKSMESIGLCWLVAVVLAAILTPGNVDQIVYCIAWPKVEPYKHWPDIIRFCSPLKHFTWILSFSNGLQTIPFFITFVINVILYVCIIKGLDQCIHRMSLHGVSKSKDTGMRNQIGKMLVVNGVVFFTLLVPFELFSFFGMIATYRITGDEPAYIITNEDIRRYILLLCQLLSYINSAVNPIIYTVMCRRYRQAFREACLPTACLDRTFRKRPGCGSCGGAATKHIPLKSFSQAVKDTNV